MGGSVGRAGIKRRKRKRSLPPVEASEGIIEDLQDQAEWSSYTQNLPRLGDSRRNAIWWNRGIRFYRGAAHADENYSLRSSYWWTGLRTGILLVVGVALVGWLLFRVL
jgi:hypothetical protein